MKSPQMTFLSPYDPRDVRKASGTIFFLHQAARFGALPVVSGRPGDFFFYSLTRCLNRLGFVGDLRLPTRFSRVLIWPYISFRLLFKKGDVIVAMLCSRYLPHLYTRRPMLVS